MTRKVFGLTLFSSILSFFGFNKPIKPPAEEIVMYEGVPLKINRMEIVVRPDKMPKSNYKIEIGDPKFL